ncbi:MarR family protein [Lachnospiraceae bacterium]|nr:MarR family protein [Lachnospiraceae bacterium]
MNFDNVELSEAVVEKLCEPDVGFLIKTISEKFKCSVDVATGSLGLTMSQMLVLIILNRLGGTANQRTIEKALDVSHPTVVGLVARLEKNGFVTCSIDPENRRNKIVGLTDKSRDALKHFEDGHRLFLRKVFKGFTDAESEEFIRMLMKLRSNLGLSN